MTAGAEDGQALYDAGYYARYEGGSYDRGGHWTRFFGYIADEIVARWAPARALDAGCALGVLVEELRRRDVDAWGVDVSEFAVASMPDQVRAFCRQGSLAEPLPDGLPERFDLITCIEVLEHMPPAEADRAIAQLTSRTDRILFSSTPDGYAEPTHFSCRPPEEWSAVFARHGFFREVDADASFVAPWAVVYSRRSPTVFEVVMAYDREHARLREENRQLRARVIEQDRELARAESSGPAGLRAELLAARDAAVGAEAEAAATMARLRDVERQARERAGAWVAADVEARLRASSTWRAGVAVLRPLHWLRARARSRR